MRSIGSLNKDEKAVSIVVATVMLMAVGMMLMGDFFVNYTPLIGEEDESQHMYDVHNQMIGVRNIVSLLMETEDTNIELLVGIRLGTPGCAYQAIGKANGDLSIDPSRSSVEINRTNPDASVYRSFGNLKFVSQNMYFQDQRVVYECGGVLVDQYGHSSFISNPDFEAIYKDGYINVSFTSVSLAGSVASVGGSGTRLVRASLIQSNDNDPTDWEGLSRDLTFEIHTQHPDAWIDFMNSTLKKSGFTYDNTLAADGDFIVQERPWGLRVVIANVDHYKSTQGVVEIELE